jgi:hypothetical protein
MRPNRVLTGPSPPFTIVAMSRGDERKAIHELRLQMNALMQNSDATPGCKAIASLMVAACSCRNAEMPSKVALAMLADYLVHGDPLQ